MRLKFPVYSYTNLTIGSALSGRAYKTNAMLTHFQLIEYIYPNTCRDEQNRLRKINDFSLYEEGAFEILSSEN